MQLEIYNLIAEKNRISVSLEAICDSYSSLLWDIEFYQCGCFEVYIAASPQNVSIFQRGRIVARSDDAQHFGIIESLQLETDAEKGDYLTVTGRFLACLLERRIIYPTITANGSYEDVVRKVLSRNVISAGIRNLPGFSMGTVSGDCQVIALFGIGLQLQRFNDAEVLCIIAPCHNSATLKDGYILGTGSDIHLETATLVELNVP